MEQLSGMHEVMVDDRNRVAIPAKVMRTFRSIAGVADEDAPLDVVVGLSLGPNLGVYPKNVHEKLVEYLNGKPKYNTDWGRIRSWVIGTAETQQLDKQNRFKVPGLLGKQLGLAGEIVVRGVNDHLELVARTTWEKNFEKYVDEFDELFRRAEASL